MQLASKEALKYKIRCCFVRRCSSLGFDDDPSFAFHGYHIHFPKITPAHKFIFFFPTLRTLRPWHVRPINYRVYRQQKYQYLRCTTRFGFVGYSRIVVYLGCFRNVEQHHAMLPSLFTQAPTRHELFSLNWKIRPYSALLQFLPASSRKKL